VEHELALIVSGASGARIALRFASLAVSCGQLRSLHVVVTNPGRQVLAHELGKEYASATRLCERIAERSGVPTSLRPWPDSRLTAPIASGSYPLAGVVVLPCSAGMAGALAHGISRGLGQRVADVALKQRWPLILGVRETPMSQILLENLMTLARAGAHVVPPIPAFYLPLRPAEALDQIIDHYCLRLFDLLGIEVALEELRWNPQ
jgi:4-hydroxy-3-polyprenylbenzoate decarboxylase